MHDAKGVVAFIFLLVFTASSLETLVFTIVKITQKILADGA